MQDIAEQSLSALETKVVIILLVESRNAELKLSF